jgi:hypothetical protein
MLGRRSRRVSIGKQTGPLGAWITLALPLVAAMRFLMKLYMVQEILVVLLLLAVSTVTILAFAVAFVLCHEGICRTALWAKTGFKWFHEYSKKRTYFPGHRLDALSYVGGTVPPEHGLARSNRAIPS